MPILIMLIDIIIIAALVIGLVYVGVKRYRDYKKETFEKRDN